MIEILPINHIQDTDAPIFGTLPAALGKLARINFPVAKGFVVSAPELHLKTILEKYDLGEKEIFEQSLTLIKKEIILTPVPEVLIREVGKKTKFYVNQIEIVGVKNLWITLLDIWLAEIKQRLWKDGFFPGVSENLEPLIVIPVTKLQSFGTALFDETLDEVVVSVSSGKLEPKDLKVLESLVTDSNKKLFIPHSYNWILDETIKLVRVLPYTPIPLVYRPEIISDVATKTPKNKSTIRLFLDMSKGLVVNREVDGVYISAEKIFDLNMPSDSFENLLYQLVESANTFPNSPILFKLADKSEGMGKVRGALRLLHQKNLLDPMVEVVDFARHKKGLTNVHLVVPFVRGANELVLLKRELAVAKLARKNSLELWLELAVPENIINLDDYLTVGIDGVVLNLDEMISHFSGFDLEHEELTFYKKEVGGLLKFLEDSLKVLHKSKIPFIAIGSLTLYPEVLDFLVEKGVYGLVIERFEAESAHDLLRQSEKKLVLRRTS